MIMSINDEWKDESSNDQLQVNKDLNMKITEKSKDELIFQDDDLFNVKKKIFENEISFKM